MMMMMMVVVVVVVVMMTKRSIVIFGQQQNYRYRYLSLKIHSRQRSIAFGQQKKFTNISIICPPAKPCTASTTKIDFAMNFFPFVPIIIIIIIILEFIYFLIRLLCTRTLKTSHSNNVREKN